MSTRAMSFFLLLSLAPAAFAARAEAAGNGELVPFEFSGPVPTAEGVRPVCGFDGPAFPENLAVYASGGYSGRQTDLLIDTTGHRATRYDIAVNSPGRPVALILGSYERALWNIGWTEGTKIAAVLATGYHNQVVAGLPKGTPILISTYENRGPCGYAYVAETELLKLNPLSRKVFAKTVDMVYLAKDGKAAVGDPLPPGAHLVTSAATSPESLIVKAKPLPKANVMSCSSPPAKGKGTGEFACYGLWDYGDSFGNDQFMCGGYGGEESARPKSDVGCIISTSACASGKAVASRAIAIRGASDLDISQIAERLNATKEQVRKELITIWEYTCASPDIQPPRRDDPPVFRR